jgi:hypothetical protein
MVRLEHAISKPENGSEIDQLDSQRTVTEPDQSNEEGNGADLSGTLLAINFEAYRSGKEQNRVR